MDVYIPKTNVVSVKMQKYSATSVKSYDGTIMSIVRYNRYVVKTRMLMIIPTRHRFMIIICCGHSPFSPPYLYTCIIKYKPRQLVIMFSKLNINIDKCNASCVISICGNAIGFFYCPIISCLNDTLDIYKQCSDTNHDGSNLLF